MKKVHVPGSCGELVQGMEQDELFLVTCPINLYATASLIREKWRNPYKIAKARRLTLEYFGLNKWLNIKVESQLPKGKGMASSSADIAATIELVAWELGKKLSPDEIGRIAARIEPTDGVFCPGIVKYAYRSGRLLESWGNPPPLKILIFDGGGTVNTLRFNRQAKVSEYYRAHRDEISKAVAMVKKGIEEKNLEVLGSGATLSGYLNQGLLFKPNLEDVIFISEKYGAVGVNVAHSGTVMGVLFSPATEIKQRLICKEEILSTCKQLRFVKEVDVISGGVEWEEV